MEFRLRTSESGDDPRATVPSPEEAMAKTIDWLYDRRG
jgi:hypothetical protein